MKTWYKTNNQISQCVIYYNKCMVSLPPKCSFLYTKPLGDYGSVVLNSVYTISRKPLVCCPFPNLIFLSPLSLDSFSPLLVLGLPWPFRISPKNNSVHIGCCFPVWCLDLSPWEEIHVYTASTFVPLFYCWCGNSCFGYCKDCSRKNVCEDKEKCDKSRFQVNLIW